MLQPMPVLHTPHNTCVLSSSPLCSRPRDATRAWTRKLPILTHFSNLAPEGRSTSTPSSPVAYHVCVCTVRTRHVVGRGHSVAQNAQMDLRREAEVSERAAFFCSLLCRRCIYSCLDPLYRTFPASFLLSVDHSIAARSLTFPHPHRASEGRNDITRPIIEGRRGEPPTAFLSECVPTSRLK